jgi:hypothetical protein
MENLASTQMMIQLPGPIRNWFASAERAKDCHLGWIAAVSAQNWPVLTDLDAGHVVLGDDGLICLAVWSASKAYASVVLHSGRITAGGTAADNVRFSIAACVKANLIPA